MQSLTGLAAVRGTITWGFIWGNGRRERNSSKQGEKIVILFWMTIRVLNVKPRDGKEPCRFLFYLCCTKPSCDHTMGLADFLGRCNRGFSCGCAAPLEERVYLSWLVSKWIRVETYKCEGHVGSGLQCWARSLCPLSESGLMLFFIQNNLPVDSNCWKSIHWNTWM